MKVFMIGGTGLLGSQAAVELIQRGHEVTSVALPPLPIGAVLPKEMTIEFGNYLEMSDEAILAKMAGCEGFVFAAGVDERVEGPKPIYDLYKKYNIDPVDRLLGLAKKAGIKHAVICGSYFSYFAKLHPEWKLTAIHPYIRSRIDQEKAAEKQSEGLDVAVLELPYIFGTQPGRKPVWVFLAKMIRDSKKRIYYPKGGSAMVTVKQVGEAIAGALEKNVGFATYPIGYWNLTWVEMLAIMDQYLGCPDKPIQTIPNWMFTLGGIQIRHTQKKQGIDGGLNLAKYAKVMGSDLFIDKALGCDKLGVRDDDLDQAIGDSILLSAAVLDNKVAALDMKAK
jgi:nucleoside-diphosphate-sugar epimerase